jgi:N utilization substance protein A
MARVKIDNELFQVVAHFSRFTGVTPKDTIVGFDETLTFVVDGDQIGRAIGPQGRNVRMIEEALKKRVRIVAFDADLRGFIENVIRPLQIRGIEEQEGVVTLHAADSRSRSLLIGRAAMHLRTFESIVKRFFPTVKELKVA